MTMHRAPARHSLIAILVCMHVAVIAASNYLVQIPFVLFGFNTTWGAFTYPFIFLATDLTVRLFGAPTARRIVFWAMFPALIVSYLLSMWFVGGRFVGWAAVLAPSVMVVRIVLASFSAYIWGQLMDIVVFRCLRELRTWWIAPTASNTVGSFMDTVVFFSIAFAGSPDPFMAEHWIELGLADYSFKLFVGVLMFVPMYGVVLRWIHAHLAWAVEAGRATRVVNAGS